MNKKVKYIILLVTMIFIDLAVYIYTIKNAFGNVEANHLFHSVIFLEVAVYSTLILFEVSKEEKK